eukprot:scaffold103520_cov63-Phaeocystis_antarctica.AAC.4
MIRLHGRVSPAVSHRCSFTVRLPTLDVCILKSTPTVGTMVGRFCSFVNAASSDDLPTPWFPTIATLNTSSIISESVRFVFAANALSRRRPKVDATRGPQLKIRTIYGRRPTVKDGHSNTRGLNSHLTRFQALGLTKDDTPGKTGQTGWNPDHRPVFFYVAQLGYWYVTHRMMKRPRYHTTPLKPAWRNPHLKGVESFLPEPRAKLRTQSPKGCSAAGGEHALKSASCRAAHATSSGRRVLFAPSCSRQPATPPIHDALAGKFKEGLGGVAHQNVPGARTCRPNEGRRRHLASLHVAAKRARTRPRNVAAP